MIMAGKDYLGFPGWRVAFMMVTLVSLIIGILVYLYATDPRRIPGNHLLDEDDYERLHLSGKDVLPPPSIWMDSWVATRSVTKVRTFQTIVLQGIIGSLPWTAIVFFTMWFELIGFDNSSSAALNSLFARYRVCEWSISWRGDSRPPVTTVPRFRTRHVCSVQCMGIPFSWILLTVIPQSVDYWYAFSVTLFFMGIAISWCATSANNPMFAEVVPPKHRTMIYAFDCAFEGSFASLLLPLSRAGHREDIWLRCQDCEPCKRIGRRGVCALERAADNDDSAFRCLRPVRQPLVSRVQVRQRKHEIGQLQGAGASMMM